MSNPDAVDPTIPAPRPVPRRPSLLLVEDNEAGLRSLARLLGVAGYNVTSVKNGESAIAAMEQDPKFDYVLTDLRLPDLDGLEVVEAAHRLIRSPRVGIMTGWDLNDIELERSGIDWVFLKPLEFSKIVASLQENPPEDLATEAD